MPATANANGEQLLELIRTEFRNLQLRELLTHSPRVLLGVTPTALNALAALEIKTVFDLATSAVFDDASKLVRAGADLQSALYQHGTPTTDLVRDAQAAGKPIGELQFLPIGVLERIPTQSVATVAAALDVQTVRDLCLYPPYRAALRLMNAAYFPENTASYDAEQPPDLLPKSGEYPTERVQYSTLLLDEIPLDDGVHIVDVGSQAFKPIDLSILAKADAGFKKTAFGALLTFNQSWFAQGVTLGQLLHSTSLAPGESTRIAVIDWSRKSRAGETEIIDETDDLTNDQSHNRSISEVTQAVANEAQGGFSEANTNSHSTQSGKSSAEELSAPLGGLFGGPSASFGQTSSTADSTSHADSYSTSWGHRDIGSTMSQNINDRTHQHAHSNRSRRASVVKEVSQSEHEGVSTRVLANYNHMHALTIQYYEVVQVYRVEVSVVKADRVVFIPFQLVDFNQDDMIARFQNVLARSALSFGIREALQKLETLEVVLDQQSHFAALADTIHKFARSVRATRSNVRLAAEPKIANPAVAEALTETSVAAKAEIKKGFSALAAFSVVQQTNELLWKPTQVSRLAGLLNLNVLRPTSTSLFLPNDVVVEEAEVSADGATVKAIFHDLQGKALADVSPSSPVALRNVSRIALQGSSPDKDVTAEVVLTLNRNGVRFPVELPAIRIGSGVSGEVRYVELKVGGADVNLKKHLMDNRMYYSQAVFRALDATQTALLLSGYGVKVDGHTVPVAQVVEPKAIRVVGNYLAFKMNSDATHDRSWADWLEKHGVRLGTAKEDIVPLATGGTFAEAVLGRSNCAEKLDITRFWNWQDSPIPLQPSDIAAIQTGSRATNEDVKPGQLSNPIVNITSPTSLPDPTGTAAILSAIQNGNMFRDMSGLQATIGLAQAALQATAAGASTAGEQAGTNMNNLLKANTERQRIAAEMITSLAKTAAGAFTGGLAGGGGGGISPGSNHSQDGAKVNYFDKMKGQATQSSSSGSNGGAVAPVGGGGSPANAGGGSSSPGSPQTYEEGSAAAGWSNNPGILAATWGDGQPRSSLIQKAMDYGFSTNDPALPDGIDVVTGASPTVSPIDPFPPAVPDHMVADAKLQAALDAAIASAESSLGFSPGTFPVPMTICDTTAITGPFPVAGFKEDEEDYIASLAKVGVMYAAYALRDMVRRFAVALNITTSKDLFAQLPRMNDAIYDAAPPELAKVPGIKSEHILPHYEKAFSATPSNGGLDVQFSALYDAALEAMIVPSSNGHAAECVHGVGYGYLNGCLAAGGFFDAATQKGLWVAGDYMGGTQWPPAKLVITSNDGPSAQASTTRAMARLITLISSGLALDSASCGQMIGRMARAAVGPDEPWIARTGGFPKTVVTADKIGQGPLNNPNQTMVDSEVSVLTDPVSTGMSYVVAWQNLLNTGTPIQFSHIAKIIRDTITAYEAP